MPALSDEQRHKLLLAGAGDIRHLFDRVEQLRSKYKRESLDQDRARRLLDEIRPLRTELFEGPFGENSLFAKTRARILTPEGVARVERDEDDRRSFQHLASVRMTVLRLSTAMGLSDEQRRRLEELLLAETQPVAAFRNVTVFRNVSRAACYLVVFVQMEQIPLEKLKPLFDPRQWRTLQIKLSEIPKYRAELHQLGISLDEGETPPR